MDHIRIGDVGPHVEDVQRRLGDVGHDCSVDESGRFDVSTDAAVRGFQQERGLHADGVVGEETWAALVAASFRLGDRLLFLTRPLLRGDDVRDLQRRLNGLGFDAGYDDGLYGTRTVAALSDFQENVGLAPDGILGPGTLDAIGRVSRGQTPAPAFVARERAALRHPPRTALAGARILIDPGHGPDDPGVASPDGTREHEVTWRLATLVEGQLAARGAVVLLSRGPATTPSSLERVTLANAEGVDAIVSLHMNGSSSTCARGAAAYYFGRDGHVSEQGRHLADLVVDAVVEASGTAHCRTHPSTMAILGHSRAPAVVVEPGFLTHPDEGRALVDATHQRVLATAITGALVRFLVGSGEPTVRAAAPQGRSTGRIDERVGEPAGA